MMPMIKQCAASNCYYNKDHKCHAEAITIGGSVPVCDTFCTSEKHGGPAKAGRVGACHVTDCRWNQDMSCTATGINMCMHESQIECCTYEVT